MIFPLLYWITLTIKRIRKEKTLFLTLTLQNTHIVICVKLISLFYHYEKTGNTIYSRINTRMSSYILYYRFSCESIVQLDEYHNRTKYFLWNYFIDRIWKCLQCSMNPSWWIRFWKFCKWSGNATSRLWK